MVVDYIIVGQGFAGTALAWNLHWTGAKILVVDRGDPGSASRIAAGLMTPITGRRLVKSWRWDELWPAAVAFYRRVEKATSASFFHERPMVRLFVDERERDSFAARAARAEIRPLVGTPTPFVDERLFAVPWGGFEMSPAGQLDAASYLKASRKYFDRRGCLLAVEIDPPNDFASNAKMLTMPRFAVAARRAIFCQGVEALSCPWFSRIGFRPSKGEILTLHIPNLPERRIVHRGVWLSPLGDDLFRAGSTFEWNTLDAAPTVTGREAICSGVRAFFRESFEVVDHVAAVRPTMRNYLPVVGVNSKDERLGCFNGLGSKGALQAPFLAEHFARRLIEGRPLDVEFEDDKWSICARGADA